MIIILYKAIIYVNVISIIVIIIIKQLARSIL